MRPLKYFFLMFLTLNGISGVNENNAQVIRGKVVDKQTQMSLPGATIVLIDSSPLNATASNQEGEFRLNNVPLGRQGIQVSYIGYHAVYAKNLIVNSARETVLLIEMDEKVETTKEVTVIGNFRKDKALNKMASVSARTFTVEEAGRYAGSREDVARMATNFAGVSGANDQRNDIIIRGNTPSGLLWRLEDVDIPNPNHFAATGTTGGPIGMINNNTLRNSDFYTGAFPAEFGNVFSGVFDLKMREGNNEKYEFLGQVSFNGFELGAEGPLKKGGKSSFMANYRYSTLEVFDLFGISFGTAGIPRYQDVNFKLSFPLKKGKLTWFGLAGKSSIAMLDSEKKGADLFSYEGTDILSGSSSVATGANLSFFHNENTFSKFVGAFVYQNGLSNVNKLEPGQLPIPRYREDNAEDRLSFKYIFNTKINRRLSGRAGLTIDRFGYKLNTKYWDETWKYLLDQSKTVFEGTTLVQAYTQWVYKFSDNFEIKPGLNSAMFLLNGTVSIEPRIGVNWKTSDRISLNCGYGKHSKLQSIATYFLETVADDKTVVLSNKNLGFTKAHHWVLGMDALLTDQLRFKTEAYYQYLYDVPVEVEKNYFSMLNVGADWGLNTRDFLINKGKGWNYGLEFTLEKFYHRNYYLLFTASFFDSKYSGSDGIKRNTAFNGHFVLNSLAGKEFRLSRNATLVLDIKTAWAGGKRYTPIDIEASKTSTSVLTTEYYYNQAYSLQFPDYFKTDVKIGFRKDGKKVSQLWEFYVENVTNHKNPLNQTYSKNKGKIEVVNQLGIFPLFNYRIYF